MKGLFEIFKNFKEDLDLSNIDPSHEFYLKVKINFLEIMKLETAPDLNLDKAVFLNSIFFFD